MDHPENLNNLFNSIGFGFPENSDQLKDFDSLNKNFEFKGDATKIDPRKILNSLESSGANVKVSNVEYHKRTVLAAEIVFRLKDEWSLGHLKLQKLIYLCQNAMNMPIHANFLKQAMGPYDPKLMRSLDKQFEEKQWFKFQPDDFPKYIPLKKTGGHKEWYEIYFKNSASKVDFVIEEFRKMKTADVELVATIFACWAGIKDSEGSINNELLIAAVYKWSKEKEKFSREEILKSIEWMVDKGITPK